MEPKSRIIPVSVVMIVIFLLVGLVGLIIFPSDRFPVKEFFWGQFPGILNFLAGVGAIRYAANKDSEKFMITVLGVMTLSMVLLAVLIIFSLYVLNFSEKYYILTVFIFYFLYLTLQLIYLVKSDKKTHSNNVH